MTTTVAETGERLVAQYLDHNCDLIVRTVVSQMAEAARLSDDRLARVVEAVKDEIRRRRVGRTAAVQDELDELYFYIVGLLALPDRAEPVGLDVERLERAMRRCGYWYWNDPVHDHAAKVAAAYDSLAPRLAEASNGR